MADREKVIKGLEQCISADKTCFGCPYDGTNCTITLSADALALLKQEAVAPKVENAILDFQSWHYICGDCGGQIDIQDKYCRHCGRAVKHDSGG